MISEKEYKLMKELVDNYEKNKIEINQNVPYILKYKLKTYRKYNPNFGDDRECECGHPYYRHFDTYDDMDACGCKYCGCGYFTPSKGEIREDKLNELGI